MKVGVLTSSRADFGIYLPLLKRMGQDNSFHIKLIVFGTHLSTRHGYTINHIIESGFTPAFQLDTLPKGDQVVDINKCVGETIVKFADFWSANKNEFDLVLCLGDRYEMFAAVIAALGTGIKFAHFHGGENSFGAVDDVYRNSISLVADYHFTATEKSKKRVIELIQSDKNVYSVGSMSLDTLKDINLLSVEEFKSKFAIELNHPVVVTFHPETMDVSKNENHVNELVAFLAEINDQVIITLPNNDASSEIIRKAFINLAQQHDRIHAVESLGTLGYFSLMNAGKYLLGNTSSGIIEAASFGKYVINLGNRQEGRERSANTIDCQVKRDAIRNAVSLIEKNKFIFSGKNIYGDGNASSQVIAVLKQLLIN